ncbi:MAG: hypothetical protein ACRDTC_12880 [Pseudonocardiaceae bacterium]
MSSTVAESTWRELARRLAEDITAVGKLHTPAWRAAVQEVPRHVFVPWYYTDPLPCPAPPPARGLPQQVAP